MNFDDISKSIIAYKKLHFKYPPQYVNYFFLLLINIRHFSFCCLCQHVTCVTRSIRTRAEHITYRRLEMFNSAVLNTILLYKFTHDDVIKWKHFPRYWSFVWKSSPGNSPVTAEFPSQRPVTQSFDVLFDLGLERTVVGLRRHRAQYDVIVITLEFGTHVLHVNA